MTGSDLIVEIPWIIFALLMAVIGLRLRRSRRLAARPRAREARQLSEGRGSSSGALASAGDPAGDEKHESPH